VTRRPFYLTVDSGQYDEPEPRRFAHLSTTIAAFNAMDDKWKRWTWITEDTGTGFVTHMRSGQFIKKKTTEFAPNGQLRFDRSRYNNFVVTKRVRNAGRRQIVMPYKV